MVATTIGIYFDGSTGSLTFSKDGICLGVAFTGLQEITEPIYPMVCSTTAGTGMTLSGMKIELQSLQDRCRDTTLTHISYKGQIDKLDLPPRIKHFISEII
jgi:SPRY domain-containing SOCS box protein 3